MRWARSFKSHLSNDRNGEENHSSTGGACPDFLCVGAQKGGTTWLYHQLAAHPDFWMPPIKEVRYFDKLSRTKASPPRPRDQRDVRFVESLKSLSARPFKGYARLFEAKGASLSGDISPTYSTLNDEIIQRVISYLPNLKVIFLARDPVERAWSQLSMGVRLGMITPFDATDTEEVIQNLLNSGVLMLSHPSRIVARWKRYVHPDRFHVYFFDDLQRNPTELRRSILRFLGADPEKPSGRLKADYNSDARREKLRLTDKVRAHVAQFFKDELKTCAAQLGGPAREWPARYGFSLLCFFAELVDNFDLFVWCDWVA
ncbi:MAG: hypothetical protein DME93_10800 [Verrucomicrobia bacterium]|nr:MAG: hypothetical protein DME93_10800 [Verrucomicrobiota bacterium]